MSKTILRITRSQIGKRVRFALVNAPNVYKNENIQRVEVYDGEERIVSISPDRCYYRRGSIDTPEVQNWICNNNLQRDGRSPIGLVLCEFEESTDTHIYRIIKVLNIKQQFRNKKLYVAENGLNDIISLFE